MIKKNGIRAFSDYTRDFFELQQPLGSILPKGAIFVHDTDDASPGSEGQLKLCWMQDGGTYGGLCANTIIFSASLRETGWFKLVQQKKSNRELGEIVEELTIRIKELSDRIGGFNSF